VANLAVIGDLEIGDWPGEICHRAIFFALGPQTAHPPGGMMPDYSAPYTFSNSTVASGAISVTYARMSSRCWRTADGVIPGGA